MQPQNFQQSRVRGPAVAVGQSRVRGGVLPHQDVHHPHVIRQGLGCGVPSPDRDQHPLLDRASPQRAPAVAGPGPHTDGLPFSAVQLHELEYK